jgi:hypothetical protein
MLPSNAINTYFATPGSLKTELDMELGGNYPAMPWVTHPLCRTVIFLFSSCFPTPSRVTQCRPRRSASSPGAEHVDWPCRRADPCAFRPALAASTALPLASPWRPLPSQRRPRDSPHARRPRASSMARWWRVSPRDRGYRVD